MSTASAPVPNRSEMSPLRFLERSAKVFPDRTAIVYGGRSYTYAEFADEAQRLARVLASKIEPGERVAYLAPNIPEMLIAHFAVPLAGGVLVALNSRLAGAELAYILNHSESTILVADAEFHSTVAAITDVIPSLHTVVEVDDPEFGTPAGPDEIEGLVSYADFWQAPRTCRPGRGPSTTRAPSSPSTTPPAPPESPRASCTPIVVRT